MQKRCRGQPLLHIFLFYFKRANSDFQKRAFVSSSDSSSTMTLVTLFSSQKFTTLFKLIRLSTWCLFLESPHTNNKTTPNMEKSASKSKTHPSKYPHRNVSPQGTEMSPSAEKAPPHFQTLTPNKEGRKVYRKQVLIKQKYAMVMNHSQKLPQISKPIWKIKF